MDACSEKSERTYQSSRRNTEAKLFDTFNNKKKICHKYLYYAVRGEAARKLQTQQWYCVHTTTPKLSTVSQQDSQTETLRDKFYIVYLRTACSISWSLLFDMYHLCSRQSLVNRNTKVFIVLHCSLAAL